MGYGDFAPKTIPGRSIGFLACISGSVFVSLLVLTLENLLQLNSSETKVLSIIERITIKKKRKKEAGYVLLYLAKLYYIGRNEKVIDWNVVREYVSKLRLHLQRLSELKKFALF